MAGKWLGKCPENDQENDWENGNENMAARLTAQEKDMMCELVADRMARLKENQFNDPEYFDVDSRLEYMRLRNILVKLSAYPVSHEEWPPTLPIGADSK